MNHFTSRFSIPTRRSNLLLIALVAAMALTVSGIGLVAEAPAAKPKTGVIKGKNPSKKRLATEYLRLLKNEDMPGLKRFLDPAFLLQRANGEYITKAQYLKNPAVVEEYRVRRIVMTRQPNVRVVRFEAWNVQRIDGLPVPAAWIPRLSTFIKRNGVWRLIAHANFTDPVAN